MDPVVSAEDIIRMQKEVDEVRIDDSLLDYLLAIVSKTRQNEKIRLGASPRGGQFLLKAARAMAYFEGRDYVVPGDIKEPAALVLGHRIILKTKTYITDAEQVVEEILSKIPVPL